MIFLALRYRILLFAVFAMFYLALIIPAGQAANVNVVCPGGGPGAYRLIANLVSLPKAGNGSRITR